MTKMAVTMARQTLTEIIKVPVNTGRAKGGDKIFFQGKAPEKSTKKENALGKQGRKKERMARELLKKKPES